MKTLLLLRHAKAQPDAPRGDKRRRLTNRGLRDARAVAEIVAALDSPPDLVLTSDAKRARQTAELVAKAPQREPLLYGNDAPALLDFVRELPDDAGSVMLVGHNPSLESLCSVLADSPEVGHLPTAGLAHLDLDVDRWRDVSPGTGRLRAVHVGRHG